ncbi:DUF6443 domain-containing protein [Mucilaginibacter psychrotolerans]|uniref:RHS repeat-associated core domain-containing protein n=1 Tax=Mucilaginibacter psychrotolerans TaxID=1524096 RepID=A0A4Y8SCZ0_9SPHI|nr:DUF6443 domain-containing protein [Mucilaginibacter psychrotolerans]TFF36206.1 RHS repeat-associated core domain-containing protein [Mucilaginibacter psychrotolerans]
MNTIITNHFIAKPVSVLLLLLSVSVTAIGQSINQNYVVSNTVRVGGIKDDASLKTVLSDKTKVQTTIQYADGLGRTSQTVQRMGSFAGNDVVQVAVYDQYGRETRKYLPYVPSSTTTGAYQASAVTGVGTFYTTPPAGVTANAYPYSETTLEASNLGRPLEGGAPGAAWQLSTSGVSGSGHTVKCEYTLNNNLTWAADSVNSRRVSQFQVIINPDNSRSLVRYSNATYDDNTLTVTVSKDENWVSGRAGKVEEYKDIDGHVVLKRQYNYKNGALERLSTYYVYDDKGNLCYVLPPETNADDNITITAQIISDLGYEYWYDNLGRLFRKKLPGKGWDFILYNTLDQVVMTQDANQRNKPTQEWTFIKYDKLGRVALTGLLLYGSTAEPSLYTPNTANYLLLQGIYDNPSSPKWETRDNSTSTGYNNLSDPQGASYTFLTINFYDDYSWAAPTNYSAPTGTNLAARGMPTYQFTNVLGTTTMLTTKFYYDNDGRQLKSYKQHYLGGVNNTNNYDAISITYDFTGAPTTVRRQHFTSANTATPLITVNNQYIYDHTGRKLKTWQQIFNGTTPTTRTLITKADYNELGQLQNKWLHSTDSLNFYQQLAYTYNERGWLKKMNAPLFEEELYYNTGATNKAYNGNIMYQQWGTSAAQNTSTFSYLYDRLNRLLVGAKADNSAIEQGITYDRQGNITALQRTIAGTLVDNLTYSYNGTNQLQSITDATTSDLGLKHGAWTNNYVYDKNGNMTKDNSKGITNIAYNLLNLPQNVSFASTNITYTYDAAGSKLRRVSTAGTGTTTEYINGIQYTNSTTTVDFVQTEEGQAQRDGTSYNYEYSLTDHLGNVRVTFDTKSGSAQQVEKNDYMPFGMRLLATTSAPPRKYLYNKKELQDELGVYDYGARFYDPVIGRWGRLDRYSEYYTSITPYNYAGNNPIKNIDINGDKISAVATDKIKVTIDGVAVADITVQAEVYFEGSTAYYEKGGEAYKGSDEFIAQISDAICDLQTGEAGAGLVNDVERSSNKVTIFDAQKNPNRNNRGNFTRSDGSILQWGVKNLIGGPMSGWSDARSAFIGLGHELAHVWDIWNGITDGGIWFTVLDKDGNTVDINGIPQVIYNSDKYATYKENQIRAEHGVKMRTDYDEYSDSAITDRHGNNLWFRGDWLPRPTAPAIVIPPTSIPSMPLNP